MGVTPPAYGPRDEDADGPPVLGVRGRDAQWLGRCPACDAWGTLAEVVVAAPASSASPSSVVRCRSARSTRRAASPRPPASPSSTACSGGLVPGSVTLLGGEPGIGKSTLLLQALGRMAAERHAVPARHRRGVVRAGAPAGPSGVGALDPDLLVVAETSLPHVLAHVDAVGPTCSRSTRSRPSSIPTCPARRARSRQVRECAYRLVQHGEGARRSPRCSSATSPRTARSPGPASLEHIVDTVLSFDGDRDHALRIAPRAEAPVRLAPTSSGSSR